MQTFLNKLGESSVHFDSSYSFEGCFVISLQTCFLIILFHLPPTFAISSPGLSTQKYFLTRKVHKQQKYKNTKAQKYKTAQAAEIHDVWLCFNRAKQQSYNLHWIVLIALCQSGNLLYNLNSLQAAPASQPTGRLQIECAQNTNKRTQLLTSLETHKNTEQPLWQPSMQVETLFRKHHYPFGATMLLNIGERGTAKYLWLKLGFWQLPITNTNLLSELFKTKLALEHTIITLMRLLDPHHKVSPVQHRAPKNGIIASTKMLPKA